MQQSFVHSRLTSSAQRLQARRCSAFTLIEVVLVLGLMVAITAMAVPTFYKQLRREQLPGSAGQLRSLIAMTRAHAVLDGKRYRIRFPGDDETDAPGGNRQPIIEREDDPLSEPEVFNRAADPWAVGQTLLDDIWCAEVRPGRPTIEMLRKDRSDIKDQLEDQYDDFEFFDVLRPPLIIELDGTGEWATYVLTDAPLGTPLEELEEFNRIEVICDGLTGRTWLQRPLYEEELDLFEEKNWPVVLGQDYVDSREITEDRVLEVREFKVVP